MRKKETVRLKLYRLGVLLSGRGSNFYSILKNIESGFIKNARIVVVLSDKQDANGLKTARENNIDSYFISPKFLTREQYDKLLIEKLMQYRVDFVILAGFMRILSSDFIKAFKGKILNIHPALLPAFKGLNAQKQAIESGVKFSGATVHFVTEELDGGPIVMQSVVPVLKNDTQISLSERILKTEHKIYPLAIKLITEGKIELQNDKIVSAADDIDDNSYMINPKE